MKIIVFLDDAIHKFDHVIGLPFPIDVPCNFAKENAKKREILQRMAELYHAKAFLLELQANHQSYPPQKALGFIDDEITAWKGMLKVLEGIYDNLLQEQNQLSNLSPQHRPTGVFEKRKQEKNDEKNKNEGDGENDQDASQEFLMLKLRQNVKLRTTVYVTIADAFKHGAKVNAAHNGGTIIAQVNFYQHAVSMYEKSIALWKAWKLIDKKMPHFLSSIMRRQKRLMFRGRC